MAASSSHKTFSASDVVRLTIVSTIAALICFTSLEGRTTALELQSTRSAQEIKMIANVKGPADVFERPHVILVWPRAWSPSWDAESGVTNPEQAADWIENAFVMMKSWTGYDPNQDYRFKFAQDSRLVFLFDGKHQDYIWSTMRNGPRFIALRDPHRIMLGSQDWFGWISHELSHDFWHNHPEIVNSKKVWGEGLCDFMRYQILLHQGMPVAADHERRRIQNARPNDVYLGGAKHFLDYSETHDMDNPKKLIDFFSVHNPSDIFGNPPWNKPTECGAIL
jgi:hypothetical protein